MLIFANSAIFLLISVFFLLKVVVYNIPRCIVYLQSLVSIIKYDFYFLPYYHLKISDAKTRKLKQVEGFTELAKRLRRRIYEKVFMKLKSISFL